MNPQCLVIFAAVGETTAAGRTFLAVDIRLDRTTVARFHMDYVRSHGHDFHPQFMARNPRIAVKWHFTQIPTIVSPANADSMNPYQCQAQTRGCRFWNVNIAKFSRLNQLECAHPQIRAGNRLELKARSDPDIPNVIRQCNQIIPVCRFWR